jgi:aspartate/methionine/tyrosine aminotransferase
MNGGTFYDGAERIRKVPFSPVRKVMERANELAKQGHHMVYFQIGEPDFNTPEPITEETIRALRNHMTHYAPNRGALSLRRAVAAAIAGKTGLKYDPETEILITVGGAEAINNAIMAFINPGDEVIVFTPAFMNYANVVEMAGGVVRAIPLRKENQLQIDPGEVSRAVNDKTRMIVLNNPGNPTGVVYHQDVLRKVAAIAVERNLLVFSDEIYDEILYDDAVCVSIATFPGMRERTILMNGFSKAYAMTGWRLAYLAADPRLLTHLLKVHQYETTCAPTFIQEGVAKAMLAPETEREKAAQLAAFTRRRRLLLEGLRAVPGLQFAEPKGAFYVLLDVSGTGLSGEVFAARLLEEKHVAVVPGIGFAKDCVDYVRISFAVSEEDIRLGLARIGEFVDSL